MFEEHVVSRLELYLFGTPRSLYEGKPVELVRRKSLALLAYLAVTGQAHNRDHLATFLWPENDTTRARAALRRVLADINETPLSKWLHADRETVALEKNSDLWVDVDHFNQDLVGSADPQQLRDAIELYKDDFLAGFSLKDSAAFDHWQSMQTQNLQRKLLHTLERLSDYHLQNAHMEDATEILQRWLAIDPLHEKAQYQLMHLYTTNGNHNAALAQYELYASLLEEELGIAPQGEIVQLHERIKGGGIGPLRSVGSLGIGSLPPLPTLVIGRDTALHDLKTRLGLDPQANTPDQAQVVIQGWPGIGKSTLAAVLAHETDVQRYFADGILWTSLGQHPNLLAVLANWGRSLGFLELERVQNLEEATSRLAAFLRNHRILIIVDDVWEIDHFMPLKVGGAASRMLVTTRLNEVAHALVNSPEMIYKLAILSEQEALQLLATLAPQAVEQYHQQALELVRDLEGLPLALQVAGRLLNAEMSLGWGIDDLLQELREGRRLLDAQVPADRTELAQETSLTITVLLKRSVERLSTEIQEKFALLGVFAPKPATFTLPAIAAVWDVADARPAIRTLVNRGLLEPASNASFQMHGLLVLLAKSMFEHSE